MNTVIAVTGTPGTGKTTLAKALSKELKIPYIDVNAIIKERSLSSGYDKARDCEIIDEKKLKNELDKVISGVVDSHLSYVMEPKVPCIVTKCSLKELKKRLSKRSYTDEKIKENLDSEIFEVCKTDAEDAGHAVFVVDTTSKVDIKKILHKLADSTKF